MFGKRPSPRSSVVFLLVALAGCIGENRKPRPELDTDKPAETPRTAVPLFVYREIGAPPSPHNTVRLQIDKSGVALLEHGPTSARDKLAEDERSALTSLAGAVAWDRLPPEYVSKTKPSPTARTYEIVYGGTDPSRTVTTHDGVDTEDDSFAKLRGKLHEISIRLEGSR